MPTFDESQIQLVGEGNRNNFLIHFGGILRKTLNSQQTTDVLSVVNAKFISPPLPRHEFNTLVGSLDKYIKHEAKDLAVKILEYLRTVGEATARDIKEVAGESKEKVDKALAWLVKEGAVIKHRRMFQVVRKADWQESLDASNNRVGFNVPYFYDIAEFNWGDMILLGSKTKWGKTTIAMNIIEQLVRQGVKPYYISSESGSRFGQTAKLLSMKAGDFKWVSMSDATKIELEPNAITIIDWLMIEDKSQTDVVLKHFTDQLVKTNGVLFIFMQLREDNGLWFAQNMAKQYPSLAARYLYDDEKDGSKGKWVVDAIREPKGAVKSSIIPCVYVHKDRRLTRIQANPGGSII
jgi:phage gp46-like protein